MLNRFFIPFFLVASIFWSCEDNSEIFTPNYPTTIQTVSSDEIDMIFSELYETPLYECTSVDDYGFCHVTTSSTACGKFDSIYVNYSYEELENIFHNALIEYSELLNISDLSDITISSIKNLKGMTFEAFKKAYPDSATTGWLITSNVQRVKNYPIYGTEIKVLVFFDRVRAIGGRRFSNLNIPDSDVYSEDDAKKKFIGQEISSGSTVLKITDESFWYTSEKVIFPYQSNNKIELRLCWKLRPEKWTVFVDTQTGRTFGVIKPI